MNGDVSIINLVNRTCTCYETVDKGICRHLIKVAIIEKHQLPGMFSLDKFYIRQMRKKAKNIAGNCSSINFSATEIKETKYPLEVENSDMLSEETKPKRGRPPKVPKALIIDTVPKNTPRVAVRSSQRLKSIN